MWWRLLVGVLAGLVLTYAGLLLVAWRASRVAGASGPWREASRLMPDLVRLLRRLAADPTLPAGVRLRLALMLAYLVSPIDLVPDFVPVLGYADDALVAAVALRSVLRRAGPQALEAHWPGTPEGLLLVRRLARC